jgi:hypothetical protein
MNLPNAESATPELRPSRRICALSAAATPVLSEIAEDTLARMMPPLLPGVVAETDEFRTTRLDLGDGPDVITIERK